MKKILFLLALLIGVYSNAQGDNNEITLTRNTDQQKVTTFAMSGPNLNIQIENDVLNQVDLVSGLDAHFGNTDWRTQVSTIPFRQPIACSDNTSDLTVGDSKGLWYADTAFTLSEIRFYVNTAPVGADINIDIRVNGTTILSADVALTDGGTTATVSSFTTTAISQDDKIEVDINQVGSTTAGAGLQAYFKGTTSL